MCNWYRVQSHIFSFLIAGEYLKPGQPNAIFTSLYPTIHYNCVIARFDCTCEQHGLQQKEHGSPFLASSSFSLFLQKSRTLMHMLHHSVVRFYWLLAQTAGKFNIFTEPMHCGCLIWARAVVYCETNALSSDLPTAQKCVIRQWLFLLKS